MACQTCMGKRREPRPSESMRFKILRSGGDQKEIPLNICPSEFSESRR